MTARKVARGVRIALATPLFAAVFVALLVRATVVRVTGREQVR